MVADLLIGSHPTLNALFLSAGAPGEPPNLAHHTKWKDWLFRAGQDENTDSLAVLGNILEEFMDTPPLDAEARATWSDKRDRVLEALAADGLSYYRGGRVLPNGNVAGTPDAHTDAPKNLKPSSIDELLLVLTKGLPRAIHPLANRRKSAVSLSFNQEYDIQDLLHALLRPWVSDIRAEEFTPSYAGSSTRMDFLLPAHKLVIETKLVRDKSHGRKIGDELIVDIDHYRAHPDCSVLWCVVYDPQHHMQNAASLSDLEGASTNAKGTVRTKVIVVSP